MESLNSTLSILVNSHNKPDTLNLPSNILGLNSLTQALFYFLNTHVFFFFFPKSISISSSAWNTHFTHAPLIIYHPTVLSLTGTSLAGCFQTPILKQPSPSLYCIFYFVLTYLLLYLVFFFCLKGTGTLPTMYQYLGKYFTYRRHSNYFERHS